MSERETALQSQIDGLRLDLARLIKERNAVKAERIEAERETRRLAEEERNEAALAARRIRIGLPVPYELPDPINIDGARRLVANLFRVLPGEVRIDDALPGLVWVALADLRPRYAEYLEWRCGLRGKPPLTLEGFTRLYQLSRERSKQIERQAYWQLGHSPNTAALRSYVSQA